jgi:hypothetical protein
MKMTVFWDVTPCSLAEIGRRFRGAYYLHHQGVSDSIAYPLIRCFASRRQRYILLLCQVNHHIANNLSFLAIDYLSSSRNKFVFAWPAAYHYSLQEDVKDETENL